MEIYINITFLVLAAIAAIATFAAFAAILHYFEMKKLEAQVTYAACLLEKGREEATYLTDDMIKRMNDQIFNMIPKDEEKS